MHSYPLLCMWALNAMRFVHSSYVSLVATCILTYYCAFSINLYPRYLLPHISYAHVTTLVRSKGFVPWLGSVRMKRLKLGWCLPDKKPRYKLEYLLSWQFYEIIKQHKLEVDPGSWNLYHPIGVIRDVHWNRLQLHGQGSQTSNTAWQEFWRSQGFTAQVGSGNSFGFLLQSHSGGPNISKE